MKKQFIRGNPMRIQAITSTNVRRNLINNTKSFIQNNADNLTQPITDTINFGVGEDYGGVDFLAPENPDPSNEPGFKNGLIGIISMLTFPASFPATVAYEAYKDKHKDDIKTNMNFDNIED